MKYIVLLATLILSPGALACGCIDVPEEQNFAEAKAVFVVMVTSSELTKDEGHGLVKSKFKVVSVFKGNPKSIKVLKSYPSGNSCSKPVAVGEAYLLYAGSGPDVWISPCGSSRWFWMPNEEEWLKKHPELKP